MKLDRKKDSKLDKISIQVGDKIISREYGFILIVTKIKKESFETEYLDGSRYSSIEYSSLGKNYYKLEKDVSEYKKEMINIMLSEEKEEIEISKSTDLIQSDPNQLSSYEKSLKKKQQELEIIQALINSKRNQLSSKLYTMRNQIEEIEKVIGIFNLYLGIDEEIVQIKKGNNADVNEKLSFRQLVLHMDEEVAHTEDQGIDFLKIKEFDKFVRKNYDTLLPERKGIVIARPRRNKKRYSDDGLVNSLMNEENFTTYVLIRNGENLYRIKTDHNIYPYFFPKEGELIELMEIISKDNYESEKAEKDLLKYKRNILLIQGLIDRTEIFNPKPQGLNLFKEETYKEHVNFIYDGSNLINSKYEDYYSWLKNLNTEVKVGSRVYFMGFPYESSDKDHRMAQVGFQSYYEDKWYDKPNKGIYHIHKIDYIKNFRGDEIKRFHFKFKPDSDVYNAKYNTYEKRKRANTYYLYETDKCFINYDLANWEQIDFYINDRTIRRNYLEIIPVLKGLRDSLHKEEKWTNGFIELINSKIEVDASDLSLIIKWWKYKNKIKRSLKSEDAKAVRMILSKCKQIKDLRKKDKFLKEFSFLQKRI